MESNLIKISNLNDFIFCPLSIYFHELMTEINGILYNSTKQIKGSKIHENVDKKKYSNSKDVITSLDIYSQKLGLTGKIDILDVKNKKLIERKKKISKIYDGQVFQLYAQYYCLLEDSYEIEKLEIYSYDDNVVYNIRLPEDDIDMKNKFFNTIKSIRKFNIDNFIQVSKSKCQTCVYSNMCDRSLV